MSNRFLSKRNLSALLSLVIVLLTIWLNRQQQPAMPMAPGPGFYTVNEVFDGDTIAVDMDGSQQTVRFIGVDTPETHDPRKPIECFGLAAADFTKQLIGSNPVRLEADPTNTNRDRYNRLLRYVYLPDNTLVNAEIIKQGYGFAYVGFPFEKLEEFRAYGTQAREENRGLWSGCQPYFDTKGYIHTNPAN